MARGTQLTVLVDMLRAEAGHSVIVANGVDKLPALQHLLRRTQALLADEYDWPFLKIKPTLNLNAGQRYYDLPEGIDLERMDAVWLWYNQTTLDVEPGIGPEEYMIFDPEKDERSEPVQRWDVVWRDSKDQIEVWPLPATNVQYLQFKGRRQLRSLVDGSDVADLDDHLIVLHAAAELLEGQKDRRSRIVAGQAQRRFNRLKGRSKGAKGEPIRIGLGEERRARRPTQVIVTSRGGGS